MSIRYLLRAVFAATITLAAGLLIIILMLKSGLSDSQQAAQQRYELSHLAKLSSSNSIKLTELARQYVVTLQSKYKQQYFELVGQIQGDIAWLNGEKKSYLARLQAYNVDKSDLALLAESNELSLKLVETEEQAFALVDHLVGQDPHVISEKNGLTLSYYLPMKIT
ncbi:hypothetical protein [Pseudoalteromonas sp. 68 DY56-GL68]|uniref:hypothetical protein n=1 Tax=Pseudoalteromonas sp. 68 DY56-GL68 TaxID=2974919 RepID=UPI00352A9F50